MSEERKRHRDQVVTQKFVDEKRKLVIKSLSGQQQHQSFLKKVLYNSKVMENMLKVLTNQTKSPVIPWKRS